MKKRKKKECSVCCNNMVSAFATQTQTVFFAKHLLSLNDRLSFAVFTLQMKTGN